MKVTFPQLMFGLAPGVALVVLAACSAPRAARSQPEAAAPSPPGEADASVSSGSKGDGPRRAEAVDDPGKDDRSASEKKAAEEPSLSEAPAAEPAGPWQDAEAPVDDLAEKEAGFTRAMDPSALSCSGALPLKDAICTLADRICALAAGHTEDAAERDCKRARSSCDKAKQSYAGRCGG